MKTNRIRSKQKQHLRNRNGGEKNKNTDMETATETIRNRNKQYTVIQFCMTSKATWESNWSLLVLAPIRQDGFLEASIPLDGLIGLWYICCLRKSNSSHGMDQNSQIIPKRPLGDPYQGLRFLHLLARNRSITEDGPDLA